MPHSIRTDIRHITQLAWGQMWNQSRAETKIYVARGYRTRLWARLFLIWRISNQMENELEVQDRDVLRR